MLDFLDFKLEREQFRNIGESEAKIRGAIEQKRRAVTEKRGDLEAQLAKAEEVLQREKDTALKIHAQAVVDNAEASKHSCNGGLANAWPEVEQAAAAVKTVEERIAETRRQALDQVEAERRQVEESSSLYQVYCAVTGVRWDTQSQVVDGYVAMDGKVRAFKASPSDVGDRKATADALWEEIEACLPAGAIAEPNDQFPDEIVKGRRSLTGLEDPEEDDAEGSDLYYERPHMVEQ